MPITDVRLEWRWGKATPWIATLFFLVLGTAIVAIAYHQGENFFHAYTICLGYFVAWSIAQSHYFKVSQANPFVLGLLIYPVIVGFAILAYHLGNLIFFSLGVPVNFGHFVFIMLGFFFFGLDDFIFEGKLSKWLKYGFLRFIFWLLVIAVIWILLFAFVLKKDDQFWQFFGMFQWSIVCLLAYALLIKVPGKKLGFGRQLRNFFMLFIIGFAFAYFFRITAFSWHLVLNLGTFPLLPIIMVGLYFNYRKPPERVADAWAGSFLQIVSFVLIMIIGVLGFKETDPLKMPALQWCFTVAILPLAHVWFTKFWGFKKLVIEFQKRDM